MKFLNYKELKIYLKEAFLELISIIIKEKNNLILSEKVNLFYNDLIDNLENKIEFTPDINYIIADFHIVLLDIKFLKSNASIIFLNGYLYEKTRDMLLAEIFIFIFELMNKNDYE